MQIVPNIFQESAFFGLEKEDKNSFIFKTFGKKTIKLICHTYMYKAFRDIIEKTDDDDNALSSIVFMLLQIIKPLYWNTPLEFIF